MAIKPLDELTDDELKARANQLLEMQQRHISKTVDPKYLKKFLNRPLPEINPVFLDTVTAVNNEMTKRGL